MCVMCNRRVYGPCFGHRSAIPGTVWCSILSKQPQAAVLQLVRVCACVRVCVCVCVCVCVLIHICFRAEGLEASPFTSSTMKAVSVLVCFKQSHSLNFLFSPIPLVLPLSCLPLLIPWLLSHQEEQPLCLFCRFFFFFFLISSFPICSHFTCFYNLFFDTHFLFPSSLSSACLSVSH